LLVPYNIWPYYRFSLYVGFKLKGTIVVHSASHTTLIPPTPSNKRGEKRRRKKEEEEEEEKGK